MSCKRNAMKRSIGLLKETNLFTGPASYHDSSTIEISFGANALLQLFLFAQFRRSSGQQNTRTSECSAIWSTLGSAVSKKVRLPPTARLQALSQTCLQNFHGAQLLPRS